MKAIWGSLGIVLMLWLLIPNESYGKPAWSDCEEYISTPISVNILIMRSLMDGIAKDIPGTNDYIVQCMADYSAPMALNMADFCYEKPQAEIEFHNKAIENIATYLEVCIQNNEMLPKGK